MLERIDNLFIESNNSISKIEVKVIEGIDIDAQEFPTASFVSSGFCIVLLHTKSGLIGIGEPSPYGGDVDSTINAIDIRKPRNKLTIINFNEIEVSIIIT